MMEEPEKDRLDQSLRNKFEQYAPTPGAHVWPGIEPRVSGPPPALRKRRRPVLLPLLFGLTALLAGLGGWLLPHPKVRLGTPETVSAPAVASKRAAGQRVTRPITSTDNQAVVNQQRMAIAEGFTAANEASRQQTSHPEKTSLGEVNNDYLAKAKFAKAQAKRRISTVFQLPLVTDNEQLSSSKDVAKPTAAESLASTKATAATATTEAAATPIAAAAIAGQPAEPVPSTLRTLTILERETLVQLPSIYTLNPGPPTADRRTALITNLRTERAELFRLQRRTDSLLLALGDLPGAPVVANTAQAVPDTAQLRPLRHRWSLLLAATPEQNTLNLQGPEGDSLTALRRNHETGRVGVSAALTAEYQLTPRLSVGGGVGYSSFGADLRITNKTTDVRVTYDTSITRTTSFFTSTNQTYSIRVVQAPQLSPVFNGSGQVIRYDTVYVPRQDTVFTTTVQRDSIHSVSRTITPLISKKETLTTKLLQPTYRFFTVPVLLRYRLTTGAGRWWADVAGGAQFQFFLGGTQVVTTDGENFHTESITAGGGPFRAMNVALSGSLALNYALTNRLSVSVAPSMRWQALSLYKPETGLRQQSTATGLMLGIRFGL